MAVITGANDPQGIGAATALAFAREGAKVALVYKKVFRPFDKNKTDKTAQTDIPLIPMEKLIQSEDIAETILFLASEQARMLTGQVIKVSGGHAL